MSDRRGSIRVAREGVRFRLDDQEAEFGWDEIGAVETTPARFGRRFTVTVHLSTRRWFNAEVEAGSRSELKAWLKPNWTRPWTPTSRSPEPPAHGTLRRGCPVRGHGGGSGRRGRFDGPDGPDARRGSDRRVGPAALRGSNRRVGPVVRRGSDRRRGTGVRR